MPNQLLELFIVPTRHVAAAAGFKDARHLQMPNVFAWWPGAGPRLFQGARYQRVVIDSGVHRFYHFDATRRERDEWDEARTLLRAGQQAFGDDAVWMEF